MLLGRMHHRGASSDGGSTTTVHPRARSEDARAPYPDRRTPTFHRLVVGIDRLAAGHERLAPSFGVSELLSIADDNPDGGGGRGSVPVQVGSIVWPRTHDVSLRLWVDSRVGTIPGGLGTIPIPPGSIAMRETFIPTRETIVPERETIVPVGETTVPGRDTFVDRLPICVPACGSFVATRSGSQVCGQTRDASRVAFDPAGRGCEG